MECIYVPELTVTTTAIQIKGDEARHLKALHIESGDIILAVNGEGLSSVCLVNRIGKELFEIFPGEYKYNAGELPVKLGLALGNLDNKDRFEFAIEKAVELGVFDIYPIISEFTQKRTINPERLFSKAVAAMKQSKRSRLPKIHNAVKPKELLIKTDDYSTIILADTEGKNPEKIDIKGSVLVLIGPEGGFSNNEIGLIKKEKKCILWNLGSRRLRAETASIVTLGIISAFIDS